MRRFVLVVAAMLALAGSALAFDIRDYSKEDRIDMRRFAVNNSLYTLYHEVAHLLIDRLQLPVLGREEDAADNIATWILLQKNTPDANRALEDAAEGWIYTGNSFDNVWTDADFASGYSPDRQRAMQIICLIVGADGAAFRPVANHYAISDDRQRSCHFDYQLVDRTMRQLLSKQQTGAEVDIVYHEPGAHLEVAEGLLRNSGIIETVAEEVRRGYRIEGDVTMTVTECGEPNAYYDPTTIEIIFCYELMQDFLELYSADMTALPSAKKQR
jgi:hypothetical protein